MVNDGASCDAIENSYSTYVVQGVSRQSCDYYMEKMQTTCTYTCNSRVFYSNRHAYAIMDYIIISKSQKSKQIK